MTFFRVSFGILFCSFSASADFRSETSPYSITGRRVDGLVVIKELSTTSGLAKLGVKKNDIVLDVDSSPIINQESAYEAYNNIHSKTATVLRNNELLIMVKK